MTENPYEILGISNGPAASDSEIKKAYRRLALKKHPDKNPDNPNAAAEFSLLQKSYDILCDKDARLALDEWLRIQSFKEKENAARGEKRRKLAEELEKKERTSKGQNEETVAKLKLQQQIERLRQKAADREQAAFVKRRQGATTLQSQQQKSITFDVSWREDLDLTMEQIKSSLSAFGNVESVSPYSHGHRALIVMQASTPLKEIIRSPLIQDIGVQCHEHTPEYFRDVKKHEKMDQSDSSKVDNGCRHGRIFPAARTSGSFRLEQRPTRLSSFEAEIMGKMKGSR